MASHGPSSECFCVQLVLYLVVAFAAVCVQSTVSDVSTTARNASSDKSTIGQLLNLAVTEIEQPRCDISLNCTQPNQMCINGRCACMPNYACVLLLQPSCAGESLSCQSAHCFSFPRWRNGQCHQENCLDSPQICSQQDPNRICESLPLFGYSHCVCRENFIEDPLTLICRPKCVSDLKHMCEQSDSVNSLCNVYRCQCKANHRRNDATGLCEPFRCQYDSQCWTEGDKYRSCVNGT